MIAKSDRDALRAMLQKGDVPAAVAKYEANTGRKISAVSIQKFIAGERKFTGDRPGSHQGVEIFRAISEAVKARQIKALTANKLVTDILASTRQACTASY